MPVRLVATVFNGCILVSETYGSVRVTHRDGQLIGWSTHVLSGGFGSVACSGHDFFLLLILLLSFPIRVSVAVKVPCPGIQGMWPAGFALDKRESGLERVLLTFSYHL